MNSSDEQGAATSTAAPLPSIPEAGETDAQAAAARRRVPRVTKTYNVGQPNAFTAIHDVHFVVRDLVAKGEFICILGPAAAARARSCG